MYEVEVKLTLDDPDALRKRLRGLGATTSPPTVETDLYLRHPARDMAATDEAFRIRLRDGRYTLTYKGPRQDAAAKVRVEHDLEVAADPLPLLEALGFRPAATLEKTRESWTHDDLHVSIDTVADLGTFVEVESVGTDPEAARRKVEATVMELGLEELDRHRDSYLEMALDAGLVQPRE